MFLNRDLSSLHVVSNFGKKKKEEGQNICVAEDSEDVISESHMSTSILLAFLCLAKSEDYSQSKAQDSNQTFSSFRPRNKCDSHVNFLAKTFQCF